MCPHRNHDPKSDTKIFKEIMFAIKKVPTFPCFMLTSTVHRTNDITKLSLWNIVPVLYNLHNKLAHSNID